MRQKSSLLALFLVVMLGGCATMPAGPTVTAIPSRGKPYDIFAADDFACRDWAQQQIGGTSPSEAANENTAAGAVVGTVIGAGLGALVGAATGNAGAGAAIGGGVGLLGGASIGSGAGAESAYHLQRRYDMAYQQCMYARGNQIPGVARQPARAYPPPPPPPPAYNRGSWVKVPGQYVNGQWVPEHWVQVSPGPQEQGPVPRPPAPSSGPYRQPPPQR